MLYLPGRTGEQGRTQIIVTETAVHMGRSFVEEHRNPEKIAATLAELARIKATKRDWTIKPHDLRFVTSLRTIAADDAEGMTLAATVDHPALGFPVRLEMSKNAHSQLHGILGPHFAKYYQRLLGEYPELLAYNVNALLDRMPEARGLFVRELDGKIRAVLSQSFGVFDNEDLLMTIAPAIEQSGGEITTLELSDDHLFVRALVPDWAQRIERQHQDVIEGNAIFQQWLAESPEGLLHRYGEKAAQVADADWIIPGVVVKNSETGRSSMSISMHFLRVICVNGTTMASTFSRRHVSQRRAAYTSVATVEASQHLVWNEVKDATAFAFNRDRAQEFIAAMGEATGHVIERPSETFDAVCEAGSITDKERQSIINNMITGGDPTRFGLVQAVTATARDADDVERKDDLERVGGSLLTLEGARLVR